MLRVLRSHYHIVLLCGAHGGISAMRVPWLTSNVATAVGIAAARAAPLRQRALKQKTFRAAARRGTGEGERSGASPRRQPQLETARSVVVSGASTKTASQYGQLAAAKAARSRIWRGRVRNKKVKKATQGGSGNISPVGGLGFAPRESR